MTMPLLAAFCVLCLVALASAGTSPTPVLQNKELTAEVVDIKEQPAKRQSCDCKAMANELATVKAGALTATTTVNLEMQCDSWNWAYATCQAPRGFLLLDAWPKRIDSDTTPCTLGASFGIKADGSAMWVNKGCRANFWVVAKTTTVRLEMQCDSWNWAYATCQAPSGFLLLGASPKRVDSGTTPCTLGASFGVKADGSAMWVDKGCRANFWVVVGKAL